MRSRLTRFGFATSALAGLLLLSTATVAADTGGGGEVDGYFTQNGKTADVFSSDCGSNGDGTTTCSSFAMSVFAGKMTDNLTGVTHANQVCVYLDTLTSDDETGEVLGTPLTELGCEVDLPNAAIRFGSNLSSATLAALDVSIQQMDCSDKGNCIPGDVRTVTVAGTWTGIGPITSQKDRFVNSGEFCREYESGKASQREASFSGSIDGVASGTNGFAAIADGKYTFRTRCSAA